MGAPIYLVSACTSGEEFVAAFRRYADKHGLFIPIGDPLPPGGRTRFAVTLRDGGVMIEGEAEVVSSARVPSVLHGRVGMTLRFVGPDEASKTTLGELERARLAMKPPPPSVPPRPAQIPAEPRPVPPPVQGRIDAVNALAECVAIGDTTVLGPPLPAATAPPPKAGPRFVMPPLSAGGRAAPGTSPPGGLGMARTSTAPRASTAPLPIVMARPGERAEPNNGAAPPQITPRGTPQPDRLRQAERATTDPDPDPETDAEAPPTGLSQTMTAVRPIQAGPTSDTMVAAEPPTPPPAGGSPTAPRHAMAMPAVVRPTTQPDGGPISATMTAVPALDTIPPSAPTEIGGVLIESLPPLPPMGMSSPEIALPLPESSPEIIVPVAAEDDASARTQIHAGAPPPPAPALSPIPAAAAPSNHGAATVRIDAPRTLPGPVDLLGRTLPGPPAPLDVRVTTPITVQGLSLPPRAPALSLLHDVEIAEPTDISMPPEPPVLLPTEAMASVEPDTVPPSHELPAEPEPDVLGEPEPDASPQRPRRTVIGIAVTPSGVMVLPATPSASIASARQDASIAASIAAADEATGHGGTIVGDGAVDVSSPTVLATRPFAPAASPTPPGPLDATQSDAWMSAPDTMPPEAPLPAPMMPPGLPSGDWTIARDPEAPDGWSDPFAATPAPASLIPASAPPIAPVAIAAAPPVDAAPRRPSPHPKEVPIVEPKVQIDPTLIESHRATPVPAGEPPAAATSSPALPMYDGGTSRSAIEAPAIQMMMAMPQPGPFAPPHAPGVPGYPIDPSYPVMAVAMAPSSPQLIGPAGSGFGDPRYASDPALPAQNRRRRLIIVLVSALVAVLIGIAALLIVHAQHPPAVPGKAPGASDKQSDGAEPQPAPATARKPVQTADQAPPAADPNDPRASAPPPEYAAAGAAPPAVTRVAAAAPQTGECFADVSSQPAGADIVLDQTVIGTTPQRVTLPCGNPVDLLIRKPRLASVTRTITPTPDGVPLKVALPKRIFLVKVSSTPEGATITLNGKSLGVTPTTVKVPAFESSALNLTKDGYEAETETVAPKDNSGRVHTVLKRPERKRPH
jgi:hypothetical protein